MKKGTKVYIFQKSIGCEFSYLMSKTINGMPAHIVGSTYETKEINIEGENRKVLVGYFDGIEEIEEMNYIINGDYYLREDFIEAEEYLNDQVLMDLLEWAKGNRGSKHVNPYLVPEVKAALIHLARRRGFEDPEKNYLDVKTTS